MKISIITSTYNSAATIRDTLESVRSQDYPDVEHIIIDGLSLDNTLKIVRLFPHVNCIVSEKDKGIYDAMNKGIKTSSGDIIGILNSDDFYVDNQVLSDIVTLFKADPGLQCVYADLNYVDTQNTSKIIRKWKSGEFFENSFKLGWMPPHPTFFVKKSVYNQYGVFNLDMGTAADYELMLRFLEKYKCKVAYLPRIIINMRAGGASNQHLAARWAAHKKDKEAWKINGLRASFYTLYLKPLRKLKQFL